MWTFVKAFFVCVRVFRFTFQGYREFSLPSALPLAVPLLSSQGLIMTKFIATPIELAHSALLTLRGLLSWFLVHLKKIATFFCIFFNVLDFLT